MKKSIFYLCLLFATALFGGCEFIPDESLYNNTNEDLTITLFRSVDGKMKTAATNAKKTSSRLIGTPSRMEVNKNGVILDYKMSWIPFEFFRSVDGNRRLAQLQIQEDGSIYLLPPDSTPPVSSFPPQPSGFPLKPEK